MKGAEQAWGRARVGIRARLLQRAVKGDAVQKRKCMNCRFFESNNMAGSGWCRHPDRVQLNNLVMVRKTELACRNTWDADLWEPQQAGRRVSVEQPVAGVPQAASFKPVEGATDRVTDISIPLVKRLPAPLPEGANRLFGRSSDLDGDDDVDAIAVLPWLKARSDIPGAPVGAPPVIDDLPDTPATPQLEPPVETPTILWPLVDFSLTELSTSRPQGDQLRDLPALDLEVEAYITPPPPAPTKPARSGQYTEPLPALPNGGAPAADTGQLAPGPATLHTAPAAKDQHFPLRTIVLDGSPARFDGDPIDRIHALSGLPRCCGTCRDFRRNPDGRTGTCANRYAYLEDPVVKSDELACRSSAGIWWLPNDDLFINSADTAHHARPTPFLDAVLGQRSGSEAGRDSRAW